MKHYLIILLLTALVPALQAQDTLSAAAAPDTLIAVEQAPDSLMQDSVPVQQDKSLVLLPPEPATDTTNLQAATTSAIQREAGQPLNRERQIPGLAILFLAQLVMLVVMRLFYMRSIAEQLKAFANLGVMQQLSREPETTLKPSSLLLSVNFVLSLAITAFLALDIFLPNHSQQFSMVLFVLIGISIIIYLVKHLLHRVAGFIFPFGELIDLVDFNFFLHMKIAGVLLIPLNILMAYAPGNISGWVFWLAVALLAALVITRTVKSLLIAKEYFLHFKFHFFLYICTLEVAPVLVFIKLMAGRWTQLL